MNQSFKYSLNSHDLYSILNTVIIVALSAGIAQLIVIIPYIDFGKNTQLITIILITLLKTIDKILEGKKSTNPSLPQ